MANLQTELQHIVDSFHADLHLHMAGFLKEIEKNLKEQMGHEDEVPQLNAGESKELDTIVNWLVRDGRFETAPKVTSTKVAQRLFSFYVHHVVPRAYIDIFAEMSLVWIISLQEAFIKEYLKTLLVRRPEIMKSSKQLSYEVICSYTSMENLLEGLAQREVDESGRNIDQVAKYFEDRLGISLPSLLPNWEALREANYRRNLVVHNRGITNRIFCDATGYPRTGDRLTPTIEYDDRIIDHVWEFIKRVHEQVVEKFCKPEE